jgi:hypothetical protein
MLTRPEETGGTFNGDYGHFIAANSQHSGNPLNVGRLNTHEPHGNG